MQLRCFLPLMYRTETYVKIFAHFSNAAPKIQTEIIVVVDNTLASPVFKIPLELVMQGPRSNPNISLNTQHSLKSCEMLNKQVRLMMDISNWTEDKTNYWNASSRKQTSMEQDSQFIIFMCTSISRGAAVITRNSCYLLNIYNIHSVVFEFEISSLSRHKKSVAISGLDRSIILLTSRQIHTTIYEHPYSHQQGLLN